MNVERDPKGNAGITRDRLAGGGLPEEFRVEQIIDIQIDAITVPSVAAAGVDHGPALDVEAGLFGNAQGGGASDRFAGHIADVDHAEKRTRALKRTLRGMVVYEQIG